VGGGEPQPGDQEPEGGEGVVGRGLGRSYALWIQASVLARPRRKLRQEIFQSHDMSVSYVLRPTSYVLRPMSYVHGHDDDRQKAPTLVEQEE
jgi:hypothetical protein